ncbi:hypothetical protein SAMN05421595_2479 [Austwickia chelonae]|nr:hypothetical protein SAMN05421595_2479 [Austwickia chelonae]
MSWHATSAHPRRCGAHAILCLANKNIGGSSPQVRGAWCRGCCDEDVVGLIPAGAGRMARRTRRARRHRAHPRRCGAHAYGFGYDDLRVGSSPQVRGASPRYRGRRWPVGLIPAGAGRIEAYGGGASGDRAHPRRCGAHPRGTAVAGGRSGSSPQVRGASRRMGVGRRGIGLIPAGAGRIPAVPRSPVAGRAHPRRCGAHRGVWGWGVGGSGSSPQVRGACAVSWPDAENTGLIPAGAGRIKRPRGRGFVCAAHPRRCGAHEEWDLTDYTDDGSSPQVRGACSGCSVLGRWVGLIPAGAGRIPPISRPKS